MDRYDLIDILYNFIIKSFTEYHWKYASKYSYSCSQFAQYNSYNDFLLFQELTLDSKSNQELLFLIDLKGMIENRVVRVMNGDNMRPILGKCILFDTDGSVIITNC